MVACDDRVFRTFLEGLRGNICWMPTAYDHITVAVVTGVKEQQRLGTRLTIPFQNGRHRWISCRDR